MQKTNNELVFGRAHILNNGQVIIEVILPQILQKAFTGICRFTINYLRYFQSPVSVFYNTKRRKVF